MNTKINRIIAVPTLALLGIGALAGCSNNNESSSDSSTSASSSSASAPTSSEAAENTAAASSSSSAETKSKPSAVAASSLSGTAIDKTEEVTAKANKISFAVPAEWVSIDGAALASSSQDKIKEVAQDTGMDPQALTQQMSQLDLMVSAPSADDTGFADNINVTATPVDTTELPSKEDMDAFVQEFNGKPINYQVVTTPAGDATVTEYTLDAAGRTIHGTSIIVPSGAGGYSIVTVSTSDTAKLQNYVKTVLESVETK